MSCDGVVCMTHLFVGSSSNLLPMPPVFLLPWSLESNAASANALSPRSTYNKSV